MKERFPTTKLFFSKYNRYQKIYFFVSLFIVFYLMFFVGTTGEGAIASFYATMFLTFPIGILVTATLGFISEMVGMALIDFLYIPLAFVANYYQWKLFIELFKLVRGKIVSSKRYEK